MPMGYPRSEEPVAASVRPGTPPRVAIAAANSAISPGSTPSAVLIRPIVRKIGSPWPCSSCTIVLLETPAFAANALVLSRRSARHARNDFTLAPLTRCLTSRLHRFDITNKMDV